MYMIWEANQSSYHKQEVLGNKTVNKENAVHCRGFDKALAKIQGYLTFQTADISCSTYTAYFLHFTVFL